MRDEEGDEIWRFAVGVYGAPGVAEECLAAQNEHGCDVCLLLAAGFSAVEGRLPDAGTLTAWDSAVTAWRTNVVHPLRAVRDTLKALDEQPGVTQLRKSVLANELEAERFELTMLAAARHLAPAPAVSGTPLEERVAASLQAASMLYADAPVALHKLAAAVVAYKQPER